MVKTVSTYIAIVSTASVASLSLGCVDARGAYDDFADRLVDASNTSVDGEIVSVLPDVSGDWLIAVRPNPEVVPEDRIIQFRATLDLTPVTENTGLLDISAQPLTVADQTPVGNAFIAADQQVTSDASFEAPFVGTLPGSANPVSGSNAPVDAELRGRLVSDEFVCGDLTGTAGALPLAGSTWAAIRITGPTLPTPVFHCDQQP
jgi:hypothetical protein